MKHLLNSAVMPQEGRYVLSKVSAAHFATWVGLAYRNGELKSYIGYPETAKILEELTGVPIPVSREQTFLRHGDVLLVARLIYRVADPTTKGRAPVAVDDFEFFFGSYYKHDTPVDPGKESSHE